jgi:hypothetical protein
LCVTCRASTPADPCPACGDKTVGLVEDFARGRLASAGLADPAGATVGLDPAGPMTHAGGRLDRPPRPTGWVVVTGRDTAGRPVVLPGSELLPRPNWLRRLVLRVLFGWTCERDEL